MAIKCRLTMRDMRDAAREKRLVRLGLAIDADEHDRHSYEYAVGMNEDLLASLRDCRAQGLTSAEIADPAIAMLEAWLLKFR